MTRAEKLAQIAETEQKVYDKGYEEGFKKGQENTDTNVIENIEISLNFSNGDQTERLPEGYSANSVTIFQPETLVPKNIAKGVNIAGIIGTHEGGGSIEGTATVTFCNYDGTELYSRPVFIGDDCPEPVAQGKINTPTKESDVQYNYTFNGWSDTLGGSASSTALKNITADKTVYAGYKTSLVYYTVRFYDGDTLMQESQVAYGQTATPPDTTKQGYSFIGWTIGDVQTNDFIITEDIDYHGVWEVYSGVEITDSWDDIIAACNDGTYKNKYNILDYKPLDCGTEGIVNMQIVAFDTDIKSDGSGTAPITWIAIELLQSTVASYKYWYSASSSSVLRNHYINKVLPSIPTNVKNAIAAVDKTYLNYDGGMGVTSTISDTVWAPSHREWGYHVTKYYETSGVEYPNWEKKVKYLNGVASKWALRTGMRTSKTAAINGTFVKDTQGSKPQYMIGSGVSGVSVGVCLCFCT